MSGGVYWIGSVKSLGTTYSSGHPVNFLGTSPTSLLWDINELDAQKDYVLTTWSKTSTPIISTSIYPT